MINSYFENLNFIQSLNRGIIWGWSFENNQICKSSCLSNELINNSEKDFSLFEKYIGKPQLYEYYFLKAKVCFVQANFRKALRCTNEILMDTKFKVRDDLMTVIRWLWSDHWESDAADFVAVFKPN